MLCEEKESARCDGLRGGVGGSVVGGCLEVPTWRSDSLRGDKKKEEEIRVKMLTMVQSHPAVRAQ